MQQNKATALQAICGQSLLSQRLDAARAKEPNCLIATRIRVTAQNSSIIRKSAIQTIK